MFYNLKVTSGKKKKKTEVNRYHQDWAWGMEFPVLLSGLTHSVLGTPVYSTG